MCGLRNAFKVWAVSQSIPDFILCVCKASHRARGKFLAMALLGLPLGAYRLVHGHSSPDHQRWSRLSHSQGLLLNFWLFCALVYCYTRSLWLASVCHSDIWDSPHSTPNIGRPLQWPWQNFCGTLLGGVGMRIVPGKNITVLIEVLYIFLNKCFSIFMPLVKFQSISLTNLFSFIIAF